MDRDEESHHPVQIIYSVLSLPYAPSGEIGGRHCYASIGVHTEPCRTRTSGAALSLADQLENLKAAPAEPTEAVPEPCEEDGTKEETPKKTKSAETDPPRKHHKSREDKSWSRHSPTEKSPASSSREHIATLDTDKLGDTVAQVCLSVARMSRVVEKAHHSNTSQAWLVRQCLEKASIEAVDSMKDEIQGAHTSADMWRVEKKIGAQVSPCEGQGLP